MMSAKRSLNEKSTEYFDVLDNRQSILGRSRSCMEPLVTSKRMVRKSLTFSRQLSAEGLDLGIPGVYRSKADDSLLPATGDSTLTPLSGLSDSAANMKKLSVKDELLASADPHHNNSTAVISSSATFPPISAVPPKKPPRTKLGYQKTGKSRTTVGMGVKIVNGFHYHEKLTNTKVEKRSEHIKAPTNFGGQPALLTKNAPYSTQESYHQSALEANGELSLCKPVKSSLKGTNRRLTREQLKSSLSAPFDFRKVSNGKMPELQEVDLLLSHRCELPQSKPCGRDDQSIQLTSSVREPDILSHIKNHHYTAEKYHTITHASWEIATPGFKKKKKTWFSTHFARKKHTKDSLVEPLLLNQVEPFDQGLMVRKDSHGSTEDESMDNNHLDVKDKKKKDKKKDKKGKPPSRHGSDAKQSDKVRSKLKKFISKRPTMESLQERGLIKETVFGCPLLKLCEKEKTAVPKFVQMCVEEVEKRGLKVDGIYRVSGNLSHVQKLRYMIDQEIDVNLSAPEWEDIHVITGALKMFLRELPEPVIPFVFFDKFIATCQIMDDASKRDTTKSLIRALPKPNKETLKYLLQHFCKVVEHSESNRMQVQNLAIVFGPTLLLKPPKMTNHYDPGGGNMAVYMMYQNQIIDYMLTEFKTLF